MASEGISLHAFRWPVVLWAGLGALLGLLFGALGSTHSRGIQIYSVVGTALLVATFVAEACVLYRTGHPNAVAVAVPIEVSIGVAIPFLLLRTLRQRTMALGALVFSPVAVLGLSAFMGVIHRVYPGID
jgi:hypothetical protein